MPATASLAERRKARTGLKVEHRHRVGDQLFDRVSDLVLIGGRATALLEWIDLGGVRTPLYVVELDPLKLNRSGLSRFIYEAETADPRF